jgi:plasmid stabilization system protein ParE
VSLPFVFRPEAQDDLLLARDWYQRQALGLGDAFSAAFEQLLARVEAMPELYAVTFRGVRPAKLRRFPYVMYYRLLADRIEVLGVLHGSRDPRIWQRRA